jgi:hypothetical protein
MSSYYLRVELDWDHMQSDDEGWQYPTVTVADDGLHTLPAPLLDMVRQLIMVSLDEGDQDDSQAGTS